MNNGEKGTERQEISCKRMTNLARNEVRYFAIPVTAGSTGFDEDPENRVPVSCVRILAMMGIIFRKGFLGFLFRLVPFILVV